MSSVGDLAAIMEYRQERIDSQNRKIIILYTICLLSIVYFIYELFSLYARSSNPKDYIDNLLNYWYSMIINRGE
ncbi:hypothetical protein SS50377_26323 [Spironucleus salmonicida]|uniref:Uncharacterized protein n=1 Tax=Spironucleus salmonicida TaxID=348837 RepID=V6M3E7_9EUKA|nr:hypothetical protein SS50377_26323 [Spironucleus salmonicida]|eukprot:EST47809.1 Hypothetical protein SS50377_fx041 [Spironucleus salmonicida]